jgi:nucleoside-diphosphate-sugar epimerase
MNIYAGKKVVVTGGAGFIGINLVRVLCESGARVIVIDLPDVDYSQLPPDATIIKANIMNSYLHENVFADADFVFHLAARTDLNSKKIDAYEVNYEGTRRIIHALRNNGKLIRFVLFSTQLVVGLFNETRFIDETEPFMTRTAYGESKILAEKVTQEECIKANIPFTIIRPTSVYGPFGKTPYREFFQTILRKKYFHVGKADNLISMVYVKNLVDQTLYLAGRDDTKTCTFFGNDLYPYTIRQFSEEVARHNNFHILTLPGWVVWTLAYLLGVIKFVGIPVPLYPFRLRNITSNYCYSIGNSIKLGYYPKYNLNQGIKETIEWYLDNDLNFQNLG